VYWQNEEAGKGPRKPARPKKQSPSPRVDSRAREIFIKPYPKGFMNLRSIVL
jgi:hypothetical protein